MSDKKLTKEQTDYILRQLNTGKKIALQDIKTQESRDIAIGKMRDLMMSFDKSFIKELFEESIKAGVFESKIDLKLQYEYQDHLYILRRVAPGHFMKVI